MTKKKPIRPRGIGPLPVPPKRKKKAPVPPHISHLECSVCGEPLAGEDGCGMVYQTHCLDSICEACLRTVADLLRALGICDLFGDRNYGDAADPPKGEAVLDALVRLLSRTGHKARVRVRQHEDRYHDLDTV